jgi:transketolase
MSGGTFNPKQAALSKVALTSRGKAIRRTILDIVHKSGASHIGSSMSMVEILSAIYENMDLDKIRIQAPDRDRLLVSKGHSAAAVYAAMHEFGLMDRPLLETYYKNDSLLSGHVSHWVPLIEHSTGALGHGLPVGVGIALGLKSKKFLSSRVFVVLGDGETHEGSNWEAMMYAGHRKLNNLCVLVDNNGIGGVGFTDAVCNVQNLENMIASFGFETFSVDGHDEEGLRKLLEKTKGTTSRPVGIVCHTIKGKGVSFMENDGNWHYRSPNQEAREKALVELA